MGQESDSNSSADAFDVEAAAACAQGDLDTSISIQECRQLHTGHVCLPGLRAHGTKQSKQWLGQVDVRADFSMSSKHYLLSISFPSKAGFQNDFVALHQVA